MDQTTVWEALEATGRRLAGDGVTGTIRIVVGGSVAAMLVGGLAPTRVTQDCDVMEVAPETQWQALVKASAEVGESRGLGPQWLNRDSQVYAHFLPIGWSRRCESAGKFGPLEVVTISRMDLLAMKLMGAPVRPQDLEDLVAMKPGVRETRFLQAHLSRLEAESPGRDTYEAQRLILARWEKTE